VGTTATDIKEGTRVQYGIITLPVFGVYGLMYMKFTKGDGSGYSIASSSIIESEPMVTSLTTADSGGTHYRITASSFTANLDATALTNCGTIHATSVGNSLVRVTGPLAGGDPAKAQFYWKGLPTWDPVPTAPSLASVATLSTKPGYTTWRMVDGLYAVQRNQGLFEFARADQADVQTPNQPGSNAGRIPIPTWEPCLDWDCHAAIFDNIDLGATVNVKFIRCYEIIPEAGSIAQGFANASATDMPSVNMYKTLSGQFGMLYPADFNDWGTLWQGVKNFFGKAKPILSKAASFIPGVGGVVSKMIDQIPVQTAEAREKAMAELKEKAEAKAKIDAAALRNAEEVLARGKAAPRRDKVSLPASKVSTKVGKKKPCPYCGKLFNNVKNHLATSRTCP